MPKEVKAPKPKRRGEQTFCTELIKWLKYNMKETCFIEAKVSYDEKFSLTSGFKDHQLPTLNLISTGSYGYKISDMDRLQKPLDIFFAHKARTYVALHWVRNGNKRFYLIDPVAIQGLIEDGFKSIDEKFAHIFADRVGELK